MKRNPSPLPYKKGLHRHHVVPIFNGGADDATNMVYLTKEEHIAAHQLRYEQLGLEGDRRAVLLLRNSASDKEELKMWRTEHARQIALLAHEAKQRNGFYARLGRLNSERLKGKPSPSQSQMTAAVRGTKWYNDGKISKRLLNCPAGWKEGRLYKPSVQSRISSSAIISQLRWWTDGNQNRRVRDCPGEGWSLGRSRRKIP